MNSKRDLVRYLVLPLAVVITLGWIAAPGRADTVKNPPGSQQPQPKPAIAPTPPAAEPDAAEIKERLRSLEDKERQTYAFVLEGQRKTMDWWFSFLAVVTALIGIGGAVIPYLIGLKNKAELKKHEAKLQQLQADAKRSIEEIDGHKTRASQAADQLEAKTRLLANAPLTSDDSAKSQAADKTVRQAAQDVANNQAASYAQRLRAKALQASLDKDYASARIYWRDLTEENSKDDQAWFGWGLSLQELGDTALASSIDSARSLWKEAGEKYAKALAINPDQHEAAYNWGNALAAEANVLQGSDLTAARALWRQAGERYAEALRIKPNMHNATNNWGIALSTEANALQGSDLTAARALWRQAGERYAEALRINPDKHEAANNWGATYLREFHACRTSDPAAAVSSLAAAEQSCLRAERIRPGSGAYNLACIAALRNQVVAALGWLGVAKSNGELPAATHIVDDHDFDPIRDTPEFAEWLRQNLG